MRGPVSAKDRHLVEWVANAKVGDAIPEPWSYASRPLESMVRTLSSLGVVSHTPQGSDWAAIARSAGPAAREWLERNPPRTSSARTVSRSDVVRRYHSAMTDRDLPAALETLDPDIDLEPLLGILYAEHVYHGHEGITRWYEEIVASWDAFAMTVRATVEVDDKVVAFLHLAAHRGEEALDALIAVDIRFRGGRIRSFVGRDAWEAAEELGLPAPPVA